MCSGKDCKCCNSVINEGCKNSGTKYEEVQNFNEEFNAKEFFNNLVNKGSFVACDESSQSFNHDGVPPYYDEEMFKRGQAFFYKHIFGMLISNILGLFCGLAIKSSLAILILTKMSSSDLTAYKRYVATIFHMMIWYDGEFRPGSRLWESIKDVRSKHNSASKKSQSVLKHRINQKEMALTQFGFMGLAVTRSKLVGIHEQSDEDMKCFIHVWRVIGYVLGMDDEFNICRESVDETRKICEEIITNFMKPEVEKRDTESRKMCSYLINGLWVINPFLNLNAFSFYLEAVLNNDLSSINNKNVDYRQLTFNEKLRIHMLVLVTNSLRFSLIRISYRYFEVFCLWIAKVFPFLAYYKFGKQNSHVNVIGVH